MRILAADLLLHPISDLRNDERIRNSANYPRKTLGGARPARTLPGLAKGAT